MVGQRKNIKFRCSRRLEECSGAGLDEGEGCASVIRMREMGRTKELDEVTGEERASKLERFIS